MDGSFQNLSSLQLPGKMNLLSWVCQSGKGRLREEEPFCQRFSCGYFLSRVFPKGLLGRSRVPLLQGSPVWVWGPEWPLKGRLVLNWSLFDKQWFCSCLFCGRDRDVQASVVILAWKICQGLILVLKIGNVLYWHFLTESGTVFLKVAKLTALLALPCRVFHLDYVPQPERMLFPVCLEGIEKRLEFLRNLGVGKASPMTDLLLTSLEMGELWERFLDLLFLSRRLFYERKSRRIRRKKWLNTLKKL